MSTTCTRSFTINTGGDTPLDQAVFGTSVAAGGSFFWGVRGGIVFKFNASTGALISSNQVLSPCAGWGSICYSAIDDRLYMTFWADPFLVITTALGQPTCLRNLYQVHPNTLALTGTISLSSLWAAGQLNAYGGPHKIAYDSASQLIYGAFSQGHSGPFGAIGAFTYDPVGAAIIDNYNAFMGKAYEWTDVFLDGAEMWMTEGNAALWGLQMANLANVLNFNTSFAATAVPIFGVCKVPGSSIVWAVTRSATLLKFDSGNDAANTPVALGIADIWPYNIRYYPENLIGGKLYIPCMKDKVLICNPTTGAVEQTKTGYDAPWDTVSTGSTVWAVQKGSQALALVV